MRVSRRALMSGVGAGTVALFGGAFERQAFGQGAVPKRLLIFYMPNSSIRANWAPMGGRTAGQGDATQFTLGTANSTLAPARSQLTIVDGLDLKNIGGDPHGSGLIRMITGGTIRAGEKARDPGAGTLGEGNLPVMPSIDQVLADKSALLKGPPFYSLQLAGDARADDGRTDIHMRVMSYDHKLTPMPPDLEPSKTFARVFANVMGGGMPGAGEAAQRALAEERSVLDFIKGDLGRLYQRLPMDQKPKLDSHLAALLEFERTLTPMGDGGAPPGVTLPPPPEVVPPNVSANHKKIVDQFLGITKLAFQLDLTRVVTFMFGSANSQVAIPGITGLTKGIHPTAHDYSVGPLTQATAWYCDLIAKFALDLANVKESDGSSVLDNTIIVMSSDVAQYHEFTNVPMVLLGGSKLGLKGGRCLRFAGRTPSDVWTAVAGAFGVPMTAFGDPAYNAGPLPELFG